MFMLMIANVADVILVDMLMLAHVTSVILGVMLASASGVHAHDSECHGCDSG